MIDLKQGDCLELMKDIPDCSVDMVLTDPPYGTTACSWDSVIPFEPMWEQLKRIAKPKAAIVLFGSEPFSSHLRISNIDMYKYDWVWVKNTKTGQLNAKKQPMRMYELISIFCQTTTKYNPQMSFNGKRSNFIRRGNGGDTVGSTKYGLKYKNTDGSVYPTNVLHFNAVSNDGYGELKTIHPTQKPVALLEYLIKTYTNEDDVVLDFTMGSGSTGVAAVQQNRNFIGMELDVGYFDIATKRINESVYLQEQSKDFMGLFE